MTNHPGRKPGPRLPDDFRLALAQARQRSGLSQAAAAALISAGLRTWQHWEDGDRAMPINAVELWCIAAAALGHLHPNDEFSRMWIRPAIAAFLLRG